MGHELDITNGVASVASARLDMWHRLGTVLPDLMTAEQALDAAHLARWNVRKKDLWIAGDPVLTADGVSEGRAIKVDGKFATVRTNPINGQENVLGVVGDQYTVIQNEEHAELLNTLVQESGAHFETAGALFGGRQTFISMKLPRKIELTGLHGNRDVTELYLIARNSHDGTSAFQLLISPVRPVCMNTIRAAISQMVSSFSIRHTTNAKANIEIARQALGMTTRYVDTLEVKMQAMIQREVTKVEATDTLRKVFKFEDVPGVSDRTRRSQNERIGDVIKLWTSSPTITGFHESAFGLYQSVVEWTDHFAPVSGKGNPAVLRAERIAKGGDWDRIKTESFKLLSV